MDGPPEITSGQLYAGPGATSLLAAAQAWTALAADLAAAANGIRAVAAGLGDVWRGASSDLAVVEVQRYADRITTLAETARTAATAASSSVTAFTGARTAITPPAIISANRDNIAALETSNVLGQHTAVIAALEAAYEVMWAHNTTVMHTYQAQSATATDPLTGLLNALDGNTGTPLGNFLNSTFTSSWTNVLASGFAPTSIVSDVTGFGFLTAFMQQAAAMQTIRDTITPPAVTVVPPALPGAATAVAGGSTVVGGLTAPRTWWATAGGLQTPSSGSAEGAAGLQTPSSVSAEGAPAAVPTPLATTATGQRRTRDDPEYGERPRIMPGTPAGG